MGLSRVGAPAASDGAGSAASLTDVLTAVLQEHRIVVALAGSYVALGGGVLTYLQLPWPIRPATGAFAVAWLAGTVLWLLGAYLRSPKRLRDCLTPMRIGGALLVAAIVTPVHITFQSLKQSIGPLVGFPYDAPLARWDEILHAGPAWHLLTPVIGSEAAIRTLDMIYLSWFLSVLALLVWASWTPQRALRQRALVALLILWIGPGTIGAALTASAGPCYVGLPQYLDLIHRLDAYAPPLLARASQQGLWDLYARHVWGPLAGVSAMPSMHVAFAVLTTCIVRERTRWFWFGAAVYAMAIQIGSVALGWHYAIDGYVGAICGWASWRMTRMLNPSS